MPFCWYPGDDGQAYTMSIHYKQKANFILEANVDLIGNGFTVFVRTRNKKIKHLALQLIADTTKTKLEKCLSQKKAYSSKDKCGHKIG